MIQVTACLGTNREQGGEEAPDYIQILVNFTLFFSDTESTRTSNWLNLAIICFYDWWINTTFVPVCQQTAAIWHSDL